MESKCGYKWNKETQIYEKCKDIPEGVYHIPNDCVPPVRNKWLNIYGILMLISFGMFIASWVWLVVMFIMMFYGFNFSLYPIISIILFFVLFGFFGYKCDVIKGRNELI